MFETEIMNQLKELAGNYTPEWILNEDDPDSGLIFLKLYAQMYANSLEKFSNIMTRHYIQFLNTYGIEPLKPQTAEGTAVFELSPGAPLGSLIPADTVLYDKQRLVPYTLLDQVFVTDAAIEKIYCFSPERDFIYQAYPKEPGSIRLFDFAAAENEERHGLELFHRWAFDLRSAGRIEIDFGTKNQELNRKLLTDQRYTRWEYRSLDTWVTFSRVEWQDNRLVLYKTEASPSTKNPDEAAPDSFIRCSSLDINKTKNIVCEQIKISVFADSIPPGHCFYLDTEILENEFYPFGKNLALQDGFFIACDEVFSKQGAKVSLTFQGKILKLATEDPYEGIPVQWKTIMDAEYFAEPEKYDSFITALAFEYWNGKDFVTLAVKEPAAGFFNLDENYTKKTISFICPSDMEPTILNGIESRWIRFRILEIKNLYKLPATLHIPCLKDLTFAYGYPDSSIFAESAVTYNNLAKKEYAAQAAIGQIFTPLPHKAAAVFIGFDRVWGGSPVKMFLELEAKPGKNPAFTGNGFFDGGWEAVALNDATNHLTESGLLTLYPLKELKPLRLFGQELYWLRLDFNENTEPAPLVIKAIYLNAVNIWQKTPWQTESFDPAKLAESGKLKLKARGITDIELFAAEKPVLDFSLNLNESELTLGRAALNQIRELPVTVRYRSGNGSAGNCAEYELTNMELTIGYVGRVYNPFPLTGGRDFETYEAMGKRGIDEFLHNGRAVSAKDFETLAYQASGNILKCKCFENTNLQGKKQAGYVTLIYLSAHYTNELRPDNSIALKINQYFQDKLPPFMVNSGRLASKAAVFMEFNLGAEIVSDGLTVLTRDSLAQSLNRFLDPLTGNFDGTGFEIGNIPTLTDLKNFFFTFKGVAYLQKLFVQIYMLDEGKRIEIDPEQAGDFKFILPLGGRHNISVFPAGEPAWGKGRERL